MIIAKLFPAKPASVSQQQSISSKQKEHANHAKIKKTAPKSDEAPQRRTSLAGKPTGKPSIPKKSTKISSQRSLPGQKSLNQSSPLKGSVNSSASKKTSPMANRKIAKQPNHIEGVNTKRIFNLNPSSIYSNPLLRYIGIRVGFHIPCSFNCNETIKIGKERMGLCKDKSIKKYLKYFLSMKMEWNCYHGIAIIKTPIFWIVYNSLPTEKNFLSDSYDILIFLV